MRRRSRLSRRRRQQQHSARERLSTTSTTSRTRASATPSWPRQRHRRSPCGQKMPRKPKRRRPKSRQAFPSRTSRRKPARLRRRRSSMPRTKTTRTRATTATRAACAAAPAAAVKSCLLSFVLLHPSVRRLFLRRHRHKRRRLLQLSQQTKSPHLWMQLPVWNPGPPSLPDPPCRPGRQWT